MESRKHFLDGVLPWLSLEGRVVSKLALLECKWKAENVERGSLKTGNGLAVEGMICPTEKHGHEWESWMHFKQEIAITDTHFDHIFGQLFRE